MQGARVFIAFELPNEEKNREIKKNVALDVIDRMDYMAEVLSVNYVSIPSLLHQATWMWHKAKKPLNQSEFYRRVERDTKSLIKFITDGAANNNYDGEVET